MALYQNEATRDQALALARRFEFRKNPSHVLDRLYKDDAYAAGADLLKIDRAYFKIGEHIPAVGQVLGERTRSTFIEQDMNLMDRESRSAKQAGAEYQLFVESGKGMASLLSSAVNAKASYDQALTDAGIPLLREKVAAGVEGAKEELNKALQSVQNQFAPALAKGMQQLEQGLMANRTRLEFLPAVARSVETRAYGRELYNTEREALFSVKQWLRTFSSQDQHAMVESVSRYNELYAVSEVKAKAAEDKHLGLEQSKQKLNETRVTKAEYELNVGRAVAEGQSRFAALPEDQQTPQAAARIANQLTKEGYTRPPTKLVMEGAKDPNKPQTEVSVNLEKLSPQQAGQFSMLLLASQEIKQFRSAILDADGNVNRKTLFETATSLPFSAGRDAKALIFDAIEAKLRLESGAAVPEKEVERIAVRFYPSLKDNDATIRNKIDRLEQYLDTAVDVADPKRELRNRITSRKAQPQKTLEQRMQELKINPNMSPEEKAKAFEQLYKENY